MSESGRSLGTGYRDCSKGLGGRTPLIGRYGREFGRFSPGYARYTFHFWLPLS